MENKSVCFQGLRTMATHSSTLAWKIPWMEGPGGLQSMGSLGVGHDWATSLYFFTFMHWRREWQPTPVFLPGESQGWGSLVGCCLWGRTESDTTEVTAAAAEVKERVGAGRKQVLVLISEDNMRDSCSGGNTQHVDSIDSLVYYSFAK